MEFNLKVEQVNILWICWTYILIDGLLHPVDYNQIKLPPKWMVNIIGTRETWHGLSINGRWPSKRNDHVRVVLKEKKERWCQPSFLCRLEWTVSIAPRTRDCSTAQPESWRIGWSGRSTWTTTRTSFWMRFMRENLRPISSFYLCANSCTVPRQMWR